MRVLKFAFVALGIAILVSTATTFVSFVTTAWDSPHFADQTVFARAYESFRWFASLATPLAVALFCFLGAKVAGVLNHASVQDDIRACVVRLRRAGEKT